jgi:hypothetical protein
VFVLLLFWGAVLRYLTLIPPFEGSDEREHLGYVTQLRAGSFPDPRTSMENLAVQASAQAPLHYVLVVLWSRLAPDYWWDGELPDNLWRSYVRPLPGGDNPIIRSLAPIRRRLSTNPTIGVSLLWQRFVSAFEGMAGGGAGLCDGAPAPTGTLDAVRDGSVRVQLGAGADFRAADQ